MRSKILKGRVQNFVKIYIKGTLNRFKINCSRNFDWTNFKKILCEK